MWRWIAGALAAMLLVAGGVILYGGRARPAAPLPLSAPQQAAVAGDETLPDTVPAASDETREQKRFQRADKDRNGLISREELLMPRRKAFAKLDTDGDGKLSFEEWAIKTEKRFADADADKSGTLTPAEFATTAPKRRPPRPRCDCSRVAAPAPGSQDD